MIRMQHCVSGRVAVAEKPDLIVALIAVELVIAGYQILR
jgi:hypothetical protein